MAPRGINVLPKLLAKLHHVIAKVIGPVRGVGPPKLVEDMLVGEDLVAIHDKHPQDLELKERELHQLPVPKDPPLLKVDLNRPEMEAVARGRGGLDPAQERTDPRQELPAAKGLCQVVVGS